MKVFLTQKIIAAGPVVHIHPEVSALENYRSVSHWLELDIGQILESITG
jgi:hypothetical protein